MILDIFEKFDVCLFDSEVSKPVIINQKSYVPRMPTTDGMEFLLTFHLHFVFM